MSYRLSWHLLTVQSLIEFKQPHLHAMTFKICSQISKFKFAYIFYWENVGPLKYRIGDHCQNLSVYKSMMICVLDNYTKKLKNIQWSFELVKDGWEVLFCDKFFKILLEDVKVKFKKREKKIIWSNCILTRIVWMLT